jgi:hypothetical protein
MEFIISAFHYFFIIVNNFGCFEKLYSGSSTDLEVGLADC